MVKMMMPSPQDLKWAHSCCCKADLQYALREESTITAIESDILMGFVERDGDADKTNFVPIMTHPPSVSSDLSFAEFLRRCIEDGKRHLKLDFKELGPVRSCLSLLSSALPQLEANGQCVWINADVMLGPGKRSGEPTVPADALLEIWAKYCAGVPLSLGWCCKVDRQDRYTEKDADDMKAIWRRAHRLANLETTPVVFAVNLRCAALDLEPLLGLLGGIAGSQLLFWTGVGELPVGPSVVGRVARALEASEGQGRYAFDCQVASNDWTGFMNDVRVAGWRHPVLWWPLIVLAFALTGVLTQYLWQTWIYR